MAANKLQWRRIAKGDRLPCNSLLMKKDGTIPSVVSGAGVKVGQDAYYLPVDDVIEEIRNYPIEESEDEKIRKEIIDFVKSRGGFKGDWIAWLEQKGEQKPVKWSEEDESKRNLCFKYLTAQKNYQSAVGIDYINGCLDWLDSIKERVLPQPKQEWSKKDRENSKNILYILNQLKGNAIYSEDKIAEKCIDWLKSLKDRVQPQPKQEWSEKDERIKNNLLSELTNLSVRKLIEKETEKKYANWLKSLKERYTWKPSDEQMIALKCAITTADEKWVCMNTKDLESLYEDLKKLKA